MLKNESYQVGTIVKTHNLKGEVMMSFDVDNPAEYSQIDTFFLDIKGKLVPHFVQKMQMVANQNAIIKFEDINTIEFAKKIVRAEVYLPLEILPEEELEEGEFYLHQILDYQVIDVEKGTLGKITNIYEGDLQDLFGMTYQEKEVLIPVVDAFIVEILHNEKIIKMNLPNGLIELYLEENNSPKDEEIPNAGFLEAKD